MFGFGDYLLAKKKYYPHPPSWQGAWKCAQIGFLLFPWFPALGAVGIGLALVAVWWQDYHQIIRRPLNWGMGLFGICLIITSCFAFKPTEAFLGLANFLPFLVFFAAFSALIQTPQQLRRLAWVLVIPSLLVVILGFGQLFWGWAQPEHFPPVLGWELAAQGNPVGRMASVFMHANILAAYLQIVFILALGLWIETFQAWREQGIPFQYPLWFLTLTVIADAIAVILTNSRNVWGVTIIACLAFALYQGWRWLVAVVISVATIVLGAAFSPPPLAQWLRQIVPPYFWARLTDQLYPDRPIPLLRVTQWRFAWFLTQQHPWMGWGLRNFPLLYEQKWHLPSGHAHPHNLLLMLTAETGIPATLLLFGLVGWIFAQAVLLLSRYPGGQIQDDDSAIRDKYNSQRAVNKPISAQILSQDRLILFTYLVAFGGCTIFNSVDITLFDLRVNTIGWLLLSAICGLVYSRSSAKTK